MVGREKPVPRRLIIVFFKNIPLSNFCERFLRVVATAFRVLMRQYHSELQRDPAYACRQSSETKRVDISLVFVIKKFSFYHFNTSGRI